MVRLIHECVLYTRRYGSLRVLQAPLYRSIGVPFLWRSISMAWFTENASCIVSRYKSAGTASHVTQRRAH